MKINSKALCLWCGLEIPGIFTLLFNWKKCGNNQFRGIKIQLMNIQKVAVPTNDHAFFEYWNNLTA